jgi:acetyl-CoA C-acetyltransferase
VKVHVTSTGIGRFGKRPEGLVELIAEAGGEALDGIGRKPVDGLIVGNMASGSLGGEENLTARVADRLGLDAAAGFRVEAASASGAAAFHAGVAAVAGGSFERVLVVAGEKMTSLPTDQVAAVLAHSLAPSETEVGATMPALASIVAQVYLERHGLGPEALDAVTVAGRAASAHNPNAQFQSSVTAAEVAASRPIAPPLRLLHCSAISDGAAAVVLERGSGPATILGLGQGRDALQVVDRSELTSFRATRVAAQRAYEMARLNRKQIVFAELHDAFAPFALIDLEDIGVCGAGEAPSWFSSGATAPNGRFPVNVSGGLLGRGHPVGASGLVQIAEVARQLRGDAGAMQLPGPPAVGLAQSIGGLAAHNFVSILGRESSP